MTDDFDAQAQQDLGKNGAQGLAVGDDGAGTASGQRSRRRGSRALLQLMRMGDLSHFLGDLVLRKRLADEAGGAGIHGIAFQRGVDLAADVNNRRWGVLFL